MAKPFRVSVAIPLRDDQVGKRLSDGLRTRPAENRLCLRVPIRDSTICIHSNECIEGCFNDLTVTTTGRKFQSLSSKSFFIRPREFGSTLRDQLFEASLVFFQFSRDPLAVGNVMGDPHSADDLALTVA